MFKKIHFWIILAPFITSLLTAVVILTILKSLPAKLPLFYSVAWGENQLATHQQFLAIPASLSAIALLNLIIYWQLHQSQSFFKKILIASSIIVSLILVISLTKIILLFI